jgi:hypothetical protein
MHATFAALGAHKFDRENLPEIRVDYSNLTHRNVLFGGGENGIFSVSAVHDRYAVVSERSEMEWLDAEDIICVSGQVGSTHLPY